MSKNLDEEKQQQTDVVEEQSRKILLGKRVVRQFAVKSGVQTGLGGEPGRCSRSIPLPP